MDMDDQRDHEEETANAALMREEDQESSAVRVARFKLAISLNAADLNLSPVEMLQGLLEVATWTAHRELQDETAWVDSQHAAAQKAAQESRWATETPPDHEPAATNFVERVHAAQRAIDAKG